MAFIICQDLANFSSVTWSLSRSNTGGCPHICLRHRDYGTKHMNTDVIIICKTFRVGPLGFMCLPDDEIPGNAGLLDQVKHFHHQFCHFVIVIIFAGFHLNFWCKITAAGSRMGPRPYCWLWGWSGPSDNHGEQNIKQLTLAITSRRYLPMFVAKNKNGFSQSKAF